MGNDTSKIADLLLFSERRLMAQAPAVYKTTRADISDRGSGINTDRSTKLIIK
jgi:hypothetical protein